MTGPLVLYGGAIKLFGTSLATITVKNGDEATIDVDILLGRTITN